MTKDVQPDRSASPRAPVSDEISSSLQNQSPDIPPEDAPTPAPDAQTTSTFESDSFAGFGSFG